MAEEAKGQRFSQRAGWFLDKITGNQWAQQTQQTQQQTSGQQSTGGVFLPWISNANIWAGSTVWYTGNREKMTYIASNELQWMEKKWVSEIQTPKTNIPLPWITLKPLEQVNKEIDDKYKRIKAENTQLSFIDAKERSEKYWEQVNSEIWTQFEQWARQWWNNVKKAGKGAQSLLLERMAQIWYANWAFGAMWTEEAKKKESEWINDARNSNLEYKKKINDGFKKWQKENVNQDLVKEYNWRTFSELITRWDMAWVKYKTIWLFADNISLLPNIIVTTINTPVWLTLMWSDTFIQESQNGFDEMIENGANYEEARNGAMWIWALNAWIEMAGEELFWIVWPASRWLRKLFIKNAVKEIEKKVAKKTLPEIVLRAGGAQLKSALWEWWEEVLQEIVTNAFVNTVNKDRSLLDNLWQSFEWWAVMWLLIPWWALESVTTDVQTNRQIQRNADVEALKYVAEWEQRKAQRMAREKARARFLERVKNPTMDNGYTPTPEQAQQRATEKEENEQYEEELRAEQNRETQIENDMLNEVLDEWDINEDLWDPRYQKNGDTVRSSDQQEAGGLRIDSSSTTPKVTITKENSSDYTTKLDEIKKDLEWLKADTFLERIKNSISWDQKTNYIINRNTNRKYVLRISSHHANAYNARWNKAWTTSIVIKLMDNPKFKKDNKVNLVEFVYNPENMTPATMQWIIEWIQNWIQTGQYTDMNFDAKNESTRKKWDKKYQLKYEEEWYTPWVARKDEKNISWKSGKMLKDFLKWQTIEELAKKYWVERIDVVKWLVDGMAYGSYSNRILRLAEEIKESTAPHELLHLVFDMVDPETKTYLISQVMQSEWWSAEKAEEWLADSFSNFYRTGKIESAPKSTWGKIKIFFKRVRSFINGMWKWRNQLEQMFTDIIESSGIEELQGKIDSNKEINKSKAKMRKRFLEYRRNAEKTQEKTKKSKVKYQKVWDIDPEATSPENLIEVNDKWLDVMVKFVSEKQKKNATDVNKELLTDNGNPYMWTSTNKYKSKVITDWRNVEDSKYKEYTDKWIQVARFTNNSSMSYSYAGYKSKLAPVKKFKSIDELNKFFKENPNNYERILWNWIDDGVLKSSVVYEMKENDGKFELISNSTETLTQSMKDFYDGINNDWFWGNIWEMPENKDEALKKLQEYYNEHDYEIDWERTVKLLKNWNVERTVVKEPTVYKRFDTKLDALAEWYTIAQEADLYHYQWVIQKMKNPLVVDIRSKDNTPSTWSKLWTINDIFDKEWINYNKEVDYYIRDVEEAMDGFSERMKALEQYWNDAYRDDPYGEVSQFMWNVQISANNWVAYMVDELEDLLNDSSMWEDLKIGLDTEVYGDLRDYGRTLRDVIIELRNFINTDRNYYALKKLSPEWIESWVKDMGAPKEVVKMIKNKNWKDMLGNWRDIGDKWWRENIKELLTTNWMDLETNDWVRYALDSGKYDWVIFKNIIDYGWLPKEWWENAKGGDVAVTFSSNQFKTWDNEDPTDSKYIRYQRVYHWSPAEFDRFDSSHMWEWEWDQVHGRWHYVAVDSKTGREYAETLAWPRYKGKEMYELASDLPWYQWNVINHVAEQMRDGVDIENAITNDKKWHEYLLNKAEENLKTEKDEDSIDYLEREIKQQKEMIKIADWLKVNDFETSRWRRNFYEVEIPDIVDADTPTWTNYFEENKVLTRSEIEEILNKLLKRKTQWAERVKNAIDYDLKDWEKIDGRTMVFNLRAWLWNKKASKFLESLGYDGIHYFWGKDWEAYVIFNDNDLEIKNHEKYQKVEYEYDENGNRKWIKFEEDNGEFDPSIFWEPTREEQIADDKENEKNNPFYNAWIKYNNQNYKDDQLTFEEFVQWISERWDKEQAEYNKKLSDISEAQNDPQLLDLQLRAVKLMEEEWNVGKKFWKNVSKEVRDRQQKEVESKREQLISDIVDYMYPWLKTEEITYDMQKEADQKEAEREMLGREDLEEKLKYFKKDKNGNREAKEVKIENPQIKLDKILSAGKFEEIFTPLDRVIEWRTPQWQHGVIDNQKNPKQYKSVMEKINAGKTKTKVTLKDVTRDYRALEKYKADQEAEKARKKKERDEAYAKKKQEEYKKIVRMKAFQRLVDMQRFEKYPFLTEEEIKNRYGFTDEEWKKITEQEEIKLPKKRWEKAISDLNKAVFDQVKVIRDGLERQNRMKQKDAEKNLWEIWEIDVDILLGRDEEKWQREVEEFEKIAEEEKKKSKKEKNKRLEQAREDVTQVEIDKERENSKSEKERVDKIIKSTKSDRTVWWSIKEFASDLITPVSTRLKEISPKIYRELMKYFQNKDILTNQRLKEIDPFLKAMWKIRKENPVRFMDIWVALANRNIGYANGLLQEYGVKVPTKLLDTIYDEAEDVGLNINYLGSYYPLSVNSPKSFLEELMKVDKWDIASEIEKKIQEESVKKGWPLDESEVTAIINSVIAWEEKWPDVNVGNKHLKKRNTEIKRTPKMLEYCDDPISTLIWYVEWMTQSIERAKFLGKSRSWNVHTLADYVYNAKNGLTPEQQDELMELLKSVFNDAGTHPAIQLRRDIATLTTLWSPSSTLTQLSDLSFSIYENGWRETLKAVWDIFASRKAFDLQDMWVINRWEEYTNINSKKNWIQKMIHYVFTHHIFMGWNAFSQFDTFWKSTFIQSTWNKRRKRALKWENGDPQLIKDIMKITDDEYTTMKIINDLRNWVFSEEVALVMYMKLGNVQPLTKAQMPKAYLDNPNWRLFYQFKTFGIKQLDYVLQETKWNLKWFKNLSTTEKYLRVAKIANMVFIMTLLWVGADELKDITMRRRSNSLILRWLFGEDVGTEQIWDKTWDNILKLFGLSRYSIMQMNNGNWDKAISDIFLSLPAMRTVDNIASDIHKAFKNDGSINWRNPSAYQAIPVIWKYRYWIYWGGQDKQQQTLDKEKKSTTTWWSSRSTRTTRSRNTRNTRNSR